MRVYIADALDPEVSVRLRAAGHEVVERSGLQGLDLAKALEGAHAIMVRGATKVTAEVLRNTSTLKLVVRAGTGLDNVDVAVAKERGVQVRNTPAANAISVAELTFGLLLALERHLAHAAADMRVGKWEKTKYMGRELNGKTLGLAGFGRIGRDVATRARAFGMTVVASDPLLPSWPAGFEWARRTTLDELLPDVDYLSLHLPLTGETRDMIGAAQLARMRKDAVIVNCARGGVVDEHALFEALERGEIRGAALDVFAKEPPGESPLLALPNVIATPHIGASTAEAQARAGVEAADIVIEALKTVSV
jgi:D-3-phosphoglycerate dehydrogenase